MTVNNSLISITPQIKAIDSILPSNNEILARKIIAKATVLIASDSHKSSHRFRVKVEGISYLLKVEVKPSEDILKFAIESIEFLSHKRAVELYKHAPKKELEFVMTLLDLPTIEIDSASIEKSSEKKETTPPSDNSPRQPPQKTIKRLTLNYLPGVVFSLSDEVTKGSLGMRDEYHCIGIDLIEQCLAKKSQKFKKLQKKGICSKERLVWYFNVMNEKSKEERLLCLIIDAYAPNAASCSIVTAYYTLSHSLLKHRFKMNDETFESWSKDLPKISIKN